ncbi:hypothetical protein BN1013_01775 [Candidatus Rubidus massiliensis]|nr:hypothetical protein BN1013_01775 [Candidatus Rubidus massiliensis]
MPYKPILGTLGYVLSPDHKSVLLVHRNARKGDYHHGKYNGLGGKMESNEDVVTCMQREQDFCAIEHFKCAPHSKYKKILLEGYSSIRPVPNYQLIMPLLQLGRALAVIGYTFKSKTWDNSNSDLYTSSRQFLDLFNFLDNPI